MVTKSFRQVIYNEGWGQITDTYPEFELTDRVRQLDPTRLVDSTTGWVDHGAGDFSVRVLHAADRAMWLTRTRITTTTQTPSAARHSTPQPRAHTTLAELGSRASLAALETMSLLSSECSNLPRIRLSGILY